MSLQEEIAALDRIARSAPYSLEDAATRYAWVWLYGERARDARGERSRHIHAMPDLSSGIVEAQADGSLCLRVNINIVLPQPVQHIMATMTIGDEDERESDD